MKQVIMTWYGITDLKASLRLEYNSGPILSALLAEEYTDIIIPQEKQTIFKKV